MKRKQLKDYIKPELPESSLSDTFKELLDDLKKQYSGQNYNPCLDPYKSPFI